MFRQQYFLAFEALDLRLTARLNGITVVRHHHHSDTIQLDRWLRPGFNELWLHFEAAAGTAAAPAFKASGRLYAVGRDDEVQQLLARFKWSNEDRKLLLPFDDKFEFLAE